MPNAVRHNLGHPDKSKKGQDTTGGLVFCFKKRQKRVFVSELKIKITVPEAMAFFAFSFNPNRDHAERSEA